MTDESQSTGRRSFLKFAGVAAGGAVSATLAGCIGDDDEEPTPTPTPTPTDPEALLREFDGELPDDPSREELLQHANGLSNERAPWIFLHQQFSIYGVSDEVEWTAREDEDINAWDMSSDLDEITITQGTFPTALAPHNHNDTPTHNVVDHVYDQLLYRDEEGRLIENIATDWRRIDDTTVEFDIRDGVMFHSGNEMQLSDVAYGINRARTHEDSSVIGVIGAIEEAYVEGDALRIDLEIVEPAIFRNLAAFGRVMEEEWTEARSIGDLNAGEMNGTGPYELHEYLDGTRVVFTKFDDYWGEEPDIEQVTFNHAPEEGTRIDRLLTGESHLVVNVDPGDISEVEEADGVRIEDVASIRSIFIVMNDHFEPFDNVYFRQAMNFAVDVDAIIDTQLAGAGNVTSQPTLPGHFGHNPDVEPYPYDPDRADSLIEESGHVGEEITIHTTTGRYLRDTDIADAVAGQINELDNVSAEAEFRDTDEMFAETLDGEQDTSPEIFLIGWGNPTFDANYTMSPWFDDPVFTHYNDEEIVDLLRQANQTPEE